MTPSPLISALRDRIDETLSRWQAWMTALSVLVVSGVGVAAGIAWFHAKTPPFAASLFWVALSFTPEALVHNLRGWLSACGPCSGDATVDRLTFFQAGILGIDYLFAAAYLVFLSSTYVRLATARNGEDWRRASSGRAKPPHLLSRPVLSVPLLAGLADAIENTLLLVVLHDASGQRFADLRFDPWTVWLMSASSVVKWTALAVFAALLLRSVFTEERAETLRLSRYGVLSLLAGTGVLIFTAQGRDLLSALADGPLVRIVVFAVTLAAWGLSVWYWTRIVLDGAYQARAQADLHPEGYPTLARWVPRLLGFLTLALPIWPIWQTEPGRRSGRVLLIVVCLVLTAAFSLFVVWRRRWLDRRRQRSPQPPHIAFTTPAVTSSTALRVAMVSLLISLMLFVLFVWSPLQAGEWFGTVAILFIASANTVFLGSIVVFASRTKRWPIEVIAFTCAAIFSFWNDNHRVRHLPDEVPLKPALTATFEKWVDELLAQPGLKERLGRAGEAHVPVYLVAAEGGGIRAAYWAATVLAGLNDRTEQAFAHHVFAVSGISGGSLGAAVYAGLRRDQPSSAMRPRVARILTPGYLAAVAAKTVSGDFLQWFLPLPVTTFDRSTAMEDGFAASYVREAPGHPTFTRPFLDLTPSAARGVPALVLSATAVQTGARIVMAPFSWVDTQLPDAVDYHALSGDRDVWLATAVHNSARFAYVSPAGLVESPTGLPPTHVIDGGYFDPTGADTVLDLYRALEPLARRRHVKLVPLYIGNTPPVHRPCPPADCDAAPDPSPSTDETTPTSALPQSPYEGQLQPVEILGELFAPVRGVLRARNAHGRVAEDRVQLLTSEGADVRRFVLCDLDHVVGGEAEDGKAVRQPNLDPPLGWEISPLTAALLDRMWQQCTRPQIDRILEDLGLDRTP